MISLLGRTQTCLRSVFYENCCRRSQSVRTSSRTLSVCCFVQDHELEERGRGTKIR